MRPKEYLKFGIAVCVECQRVFDLLNEEQASEWYNGHDCEAKDERD